jgi:hypothetical protein
MRRDGLDGVQERAQGAAEAVRAALVDRYQIDAAGRSMISLRVVKIFDAPFVDIFVGGA